MRLVADENVPMKAVLLLREKGHDVLSISESLPQTADEDILEIAERDGRIILSFDKDFGELAFCSELPVTCGIILLGGTFYCSGAGADSHEEALGLATLEIESVTRVGKGLKALALRPGSPVGGGQAGREPGAVVQAEHGRGSMRAGTLV